MLGAPPRAGQGVHAWLFKAARQLHAHMPAGEIVRLLEAKAAHCGRAIPRREIVAAVQDALACAWQPTGTASTAPGSSKWPAVNQIRREAIVREGPDLAGLWELSPERIEDNTGHAEEILDALFPGNPLLCCGHSSRAFATLPREQWRGRLDGLSLIVPSPMTATTGLTKDGRRSAHALDNTGPRRFLVCEFDGGTIDEQAAILWHLAQFGPMALAVHSGSKSLHGWFYCDGKPEDMLQRFMRLAVSLGADPATWTRSQFVRLPDGIRDNGNRQAVYFFNPSIIK